MGKKAKEFKSGDFIFAKVKGYPAWPARVQKLNGKKYFVYFYGTGETANLPANMIFDYAENKDKFLTKSVKRRDFNDGVKQIEHDFANNVPLEQVIGANPEAPPPESNDTADDSAINETMDTSTGDTTLADDTVNDTTVNTTANTTQNDVPIEDSDDAGALVIDEGKAKSKKPKPEPKTPATPKPKTPRGRGKKEEVKEKEGEEEDKDKEKSEEIVSRSGRKIRPKRYIDEQTEENTTLPSPAKKKRSTPPPQEKEENKEQKEKEKEKLVMYNAVSQSELEDLKEPFKPADPEKDNILIAYLPTGHYVGVKLFQSRPSSFKNTAAKLQWDKQAASNAVTLKLQLEKGHITPQSICAQLVMDLNLTDEEKAALDKERELEEKKSRVAFLKTEMKLIELEVKIKTCLCLDKADTDSCLKLVDELMELDIKPLMLIKHPTVVETIKRMRAYVGNAPSWELSEADTIAFSKKAHHIRKRADLLYTNIKNLFTVPDGLAFWEFFSERVQTFKKATASLNADELLELIHEPLEMSQPTAHTTKAVIDAVKEEVPPLEDDVQEEKKKKTTAKTKKAPPTPAPKQAPKRQSSRKQEKDDKKETEDKGGAKEKEVESEKEVSSKEKEIEEAPKEKENGVEEEKTVKDADKPDNSEESQDKVGEVENGEDLPNDNEIKDNKQNEKESKQSDKETKKNDKESKLNDKETKNKDKETKNKDKESKLNDKETKQNDKETKRNEKEAKQNDKDAKTNDKEIKQNDKESKQSDKESKQNDKEEEKKEKEKDKEVDEPRAKRSRGEDKEKEKEVEEPRAKRSRAETKKTEAPPPKSPGKRKSKA